MRIKGLCAASVLLGAFVCLAHGAGNVKGINQEYNNYAKGTGQEALVQDIQKQQAATPLPQVHASPVARPPHHRHLRRVTIPCSSRHNHYNSCSTGLWNIRIVGVYQLSNHACVRGQSYGHDQSNVWVNRGCRANFDVLGYGGR